MSKTNKQISINNNKGKKEVKKRKMKRKDFPFSNNNKKENKQQSTGSLMAPMIVGWVGECDGSPLQHHCDCGHLLLFSLYTSG